jgi:hypothetical protein
VQPRDDTATVLDGIRAAFPGASATSEAGAVIGPTDKGNLQNAITAAKAADVVIAVVGDRVIYRAFHSEVSISAPRLDLGSKSQQILTLARARSI